MEPPHTSIIVPVAVHEVADVHDTAFSALLCAEGGSGVGWMVQADPFHESARVLTWPFWSVILPTASQELAAVHETAVREGTGRPGSGLAGP